MRIRILRRYYNLRFVRRLPRGQAGQCDPPDAPGKSIPILASLEGQERLETVIHECLHAAAWHWAEDHVDELGADLAQVLWRLGYRAPGDYPRSPG